MAFLPVLHVTGVLLLFIPVLSVTLNNPSPVIQVLGLIRDLKADINKDAAAEQKSYDKFACWCEDTVARKAQEIASGKEQVETLDVLIQKLKGELGAHATDIAQLKKDIAANIESEDEATEVREKETADYVTEKSESEQCIGALEAAIKVLSGAGEGKRGFLETNEADLLSVASDVRRVLQKGAVMKTISQADLEAVRRFVAAPEDFTFQKSSTVGAMLQLSQNPFGDYAPQSTRIQGILKGMYDAFTASLEKANAEEGGKQKAFEELMSTKKAELKTLQATLGTQQSEQAAKKKQLADSETLIDDTQDEVTADETFFEDTKSTCKQKARDWSERTRRRTEELVSVEKALEILGSPESLKIFENSSSTLLLQISSSGSSDSMDSIRLQTYRLLSQVANKYDALELAQIAAEVKEKKTPFGKVMGMISAMIDLLRKEEQDDISRRDWCEAALNRNAATKEDTKDDISKADTALTRMQNKKKDLLQKIKQLDQAISTTKQQMEDRTQIRNEETAEFKKALKVDMDAVALISSAIKVLTSFYKRNHIPSFFLQREPTYNVNADTAPTESWQGGDYGGKKEQSQGIISMLATVVEKTKKDVQEARKEEAAAQAAFQKDTAASSSVLKAKKETKVATEKELADLNEKINDSDQGKIDKQGTLDAANAEGSKLEKDCAWVKTHFESRRKKRKDEIDALQEAKASLAGAETGDYAQLDVASSRS